MRSRYLLLFTMFFILSCKTTNSSSDVKEITSDDYDIYFEMLQFINNSEINGLKIGYNLLAWDWRQGYFEYNHVIHSSSKSRANLSMGANDIFNVDKVFNAYIPKKFVFPETSLSPFPRDKAEGFIRFKLQILELDPIKDDLLADIDFGIHTKDFIASSSKEKIGSVLNTYGSGGSSILSQKNLVPTIEGHTWTSEITVKGDQGVDVKFRVYRIDR